MKNSEIRRLVREFLKEDFGNWIKDKKDKTLQVTKNFGKAVSRESRETLLATKILGRLLMKKEPSQEEVEFLKSQSVDIGKAIALLGLQFVPGSSIGIIALEKALKKHGMTIFPKSQGEI